MFKDYILYNKMLKEVEAGNVSASSLGDLRLFKYTPECQFEARWNPINSLARGLIMRTDGEIVARPFPKFFNLGEVSETQTDNLPWNEKIEIFEKLDGSCGISYYINGEWKLATPGAFESEQAIKGTEILNTLYKDKLDLLPKDCTSVFEIVYPENRIVVNYKGETFLALLAIFEKSGEEWHSNRVDRIAEEAGFYRPKQYNIDLRGDIPFNDNEEGFVAKFAGGLRVKIKSPAYLRVHRLLNYMSPKGVIELIRGKEYRPTLESLPKNIAKDFDDIRAYVQNLHDGLRLQAEDAASKLPVGDRKDKALWIKDNVPQELWGIVFNLIDSKQIEDPIWRIVLERISAEK